jgi:hypothetical protein
MVLNAMVVLAKIAKPLQCICTLRPNSLLVKDVLGILGSILAPHESSIPMDRKARLIFNIATILSQLEYFSYFLILMFSAWSYCTSKALPVSF